MTAILSPNEIEAFKTMQNALEVFRTEYNTPRFAKERREEVKALVDRFLTGVKTLVWESRGDPDYIVISAALLDIDSAFGDLIDEEEAEEPDEPPYTQSGHGSYQVVGGRVS